MRRAVVGAVAVGIVSAAGVLLLVGAASASSGPSVASGDPYSLSRVEVVADQGLCLQVAVDGAVRYTATPLHRLPLVDAHRLTAITLVAPSVSVRAVTYVAGACTDQAVEWQRLGIRQRWSAAVGALPPSSYGRSASASEYNSGVDLRFADERYGTLGPDRPPCYRLAVDLTVARIEGQESRRTPTFTVCLTPAA